MICPYCSKSLGDRMNVFGTFCTGCNRYIPPEKESQISSESKERFKKNQNKIRELLRKQIIGVENGNQVKQED